MTWRRSSPSGVDQDAFRKAYPRSDRDPIAPWQPTGATLRGAGAGGDRQRQKYDVRSPRMFEVVDLIAREAAAPGG